MKEKKLHVLLAEAHSDETASALRALYPEGQDGLELTNVSSVSTLIATLEIVNPEVIFLDLRLRSPIHWTACDACTARRLRYR